MKTRIVILFLGLLVASVACSEYDQPAVSSKPESNTFSSQRTETKNEQLVAGRKLIKEGELLFECTGLEETRARIIQAVKQTEAYISDESLSSGDGRIKQKLEIRVPSDKFDVLVDKISKGVDQFENKAIRILDVTEDYVDTQSRLEVKRALEARYKEILSQAQSVQDILAIEEQIGNLREEIESTEKRLKSYDDRIAMSLLKVVYFEQRSVPVRFSSHFKDGLKSGWRNLVWVLVGVVNIWPFVLILLLGVWIWKFTKKRKNKGSSPIPAKPPDQ